MAKLWYVMKDGSQMGPLPSIELRAMLRDGSVDPFDLVWDDTNPIRRELVDVDEIFQSEGITYDESTQVGFPQQDLPAIADPNATQTLSLDDEDDIPAAAMASAGTVVGGMPELTIDDAPQLKQVAMPRKRVAKPKPAPATPKDPKRFFIYDRNDRSVGPLSAKEIQALFFRNVFDKSCRVVKEGSQKKVPIARFVAVYARKSLAEAAEAHGVNIVSDQEPMRAPTPVLQQMAIARYAQAQDRERLGPWIIGGFAVGFLLLVSVILWQRYDAGQWPFTRRTTEVPRYVAPEVRKPPIQPRGVLPRPTRQPIVRPTPTPVRQERRSDPREELRRPTRPAPTLRPTPEPTAIFRPTATPRPIVQATPRPTQRPTPPPTPRPTPRPTPKTTPKPTPKPQPPKPAGPTINSLADGQSVTLAGMRYNPAAIEACPDESVCTVVFQGAGGALSGRFFKAGFGKQLIVKGGTATITGRISKQGGTVSMLILGVR